MVKKLKAMEEEKMLVDEEESSPEEEEKRLVDDDDSSSEEEEKRLQSHTNKRRPLEDSSSEEEAKTSMRLPSKKICRGSCRKTFKTNANLITHYLSNDYRVQCVRPLNVEDLVAEIRRK